MPKKPTKKNRNKTARYRAGLKAKHTKQRARHAGLMRKRRGGRRLHH
jgi:hypothetical protein